MDMELLSPAGSIDALKAAALNGANAVYFGGSAFNARINAENFKDDMIMSAIDFCHARGIRVYMTLNTLVYDREMHEAVEFAEFLYRSGVDACIVQDIGLIRLLKKYVPELHIHASTQMGISTLGGLEFAESLGIKRAVLSRETSLSDIKNMHKNSDIELEAFVHGAMCVSFSGGCLFSSMIGGRSGNRGLCAQPCRKPMSCGSAVSSESDYALSLGDMCMLKNVRDMYDAGIRCVKIEGRMKKPEYVAAATYAYRRAIDGASNDELKELQNELYRTFNRGEFTKGYYYGDNCKANRRAGTFEVKENTQPNYINDGDVYKKNSISMRLVLNVGKKAELYAKAKNPLTGNVHEVNVFGGICESAKTMSGDEWRERLIKQLKKLGDTVFYAEDDAIQAECEGVYIAISEVNDLRRRATAELEHKISYEMHPDAEKTDIPELFYSTNDKKDNDAKKRLCARVNDAEKAVAAYESGADDVVLLLNAAGRDSILNDIAKLQDNRRESGKRLYLGLPAYIEDKNIKEYERLLSDAAGQTDGVEVNNYGHIEIAKRFGCVIGGSGLNVLNTSTCEELLSRGVSEITLSPELNAAQIRWILKNTSEASKLGIGVYGRESLMTLRHCPMREKYGEYGCMKHERNNYLEDGDGRIFPLQTVGIERICGECVNKVLNCVRLDIRSRAAEEVKDIKHVQLTFYDETETEVRRITSDTRKAMTDGSRIGVENGTTRGRWN